MAEMIARDENGKFLDYAWSGGYPVFHVTEDCETLCPDCANEHGHTDGAKDSWLIIGSDINYEDPALFCVHCEKRIESAYGDDSDEDEESDEDENEDEA